MAKKKLSKAILAHLKEHGKDAGLTLPAFVSVLAGGTTTMGEGPCEITVAIAPAKDNPDIGHNAKLIDDAGAEHYLTFIGDEADASVTAGTYALEWVVTGLPETRFTIDVTGDLTKATHRKGKIPSPAGFTGGSFTIEAATP